MEDVLSCNTVKLAYDVFEPTEGTEHKNLTPIIFTHGFILNRKVYEQVAKNLAKSTERRTYNIDLRSHGESPYPEETGLIEMAADVIAFIKEHNLGQVIFVCHSFSCRIAAVVVTHEPSLVEKLIFVDFSPYWPDHLWLSIHCQTRDVYRKIVNNLSPEMSMEAVSAFLIKFAMGNAGFSRLGYSKANFLVKDKDGFRAFCDEDNLHEAVLEGRFTLRPTKVHDAPTLVIKEENSMFWKGQDVVDLHMKYFPQTTFINISDATHMFLLEKMDEFMKHVQNFLREK